MWPPRREFLRPDNSPTRSRQQGYTYLGLLLMVAVMGLISSGVIRLGLVEQRRAAEQALLDSGTDLVNALESYAATTPAGKSPCPHTLQDLLKDPRYTDKVVRHLRKIPSDPVNPAQEWGLQMDANGVGITGFHSLSLLKPVRNTFKTPFQDFEDKANYREWVFESEWLTNRGAGC